MKNEAINSDCNTILQQLPDKYYDWAIVDPPYFEGPNNRKYYGKSNRLNKREYQTISSWEIPGPEYFDHLFRVSKRQIIWGVNYFKYDFGPGRIVWDKVNGESSFSDCELAFCSEHKSVRLFRYMWNGAFQGKSWKEGHVQQGNKSLNQKRIHQTEKPFALYQWIYEKYKIKDGCKVIDTHLGSGSHRIVAAAYNVEFLGIEKDKTAFNLQEARFKKWSENLFQIQ